MKKMQNQIKMRRAEKNASKVVMQCLFWRLRGGQERAANPQSPVALGGWERYEEGKISELKKIHGEFRRRARGRLPLTKKAGQRTSSKL